MLEATEENEALGWYNPYEPLEVEISRVEYRCFDSLFAVGKDQYGATVWEKMYHANSMEETTYR